MIYILKYTENVWLRYTMVKYLRNRSNIYFLNVYFLAPISRFFAIFSEIGL